MSNYQPAIILNKVSKSFYLGFKSDATILERAISFITGKEQQRELWALEDISFDVLPGEVVGLIGRNGSGKSTLLRVISGIYKPNKGEILVQGQTSYLSGFGKSIKRKLTMRENIFLSCALMGLNKKEIKQIFQDIIEFSELHDFVDAKISQFSTGMVTRLSFAIGIFCLKHQKPEVLLIDEVFGAGGDIDFNAKALNKMEELITHGTTVILASHSMPLIRKYCQRTVWIEHGKLAGVGTSEEMIKAYESEFLKRKAISP